MCKVISRRDAVCRVSGDGQAPSLQRGTWPDAKPPVLVDYLTTPAVAPRVRALELSANYGRNLRTMPPRTLFEKVWDAHVVAAPEGQSALLYIDLHLVHEVTSPQAFDGLRANRRRLRQPLRTVATVDHNIPTTPRGLPITDPIAARQIEALQKNCRDFGVPFFDMD